MRGYRSKRNIIFLPILLIFAGALVSCGLKKDKEKIHLVDYIRAEYIGTREQLQVILEMDREKIKEKYDEIKREKSVIDAVIFSKFMDSVELEYGGDQVEKGQSGDFYKEGDKIPVRFHWEEQAALECIYQPAEEEDFQVQISEKAEIINPFDGVDFVFFGTDGEGWVDFNLDGCVPIVQEQGKFYLKETEDKDGEEMYNYLLKNGDKITVKFMWADNGAACREQNMIISQNIKEVMVEDLGQYVSKVKAEDFTEYNQKMLECTEAQIREGRVGYDYTVTPYRYYYYCNRKDMSENAYVGIFKAEDKAGGGTFYYMSMTLSLYRKPSGELVINFYTDEDGKEIFVWSTEYEEKCVVQKEELADFPAFMNKGEWLAEDIENYQFMEVK